MRVAFLQKAPSPHLDACLRQLAADGVDVVATAPPTLAESPHAEPPPPGVGTIRWDDGVSADDLFSALADFEPDVTLIVGWNVARYRDVARRLRGRTVRVLCTDAQWMRTPRQVLGVAVSPWYLHRCFDRMFVPGERQRRFARRLGFRPTEIDLGFYAADVDRFVPAADGVEPGDAFLFVGRLVEEKGLDVLLAAYREYRRRVVRPLDLIVAGTGPLQPDLEGIDGLEPLGFVSQAELVDVMRRASALVLPSRFEPWGVVVHEATCAGLGIVASTAVGAADEFVEPGVNGVAVPPTVDATVDGLLWWHELDDAARARARARSVERSRRCSPQRWSATVRSLAP